MITSSQARNMAATRWGREDVRGQKTNRKGAFYFRCFSGEGFVIDATCLSFEEKTRINRYLKPCSAKAVICTLTGKTQRFISPDSNRRVDDRRGSSWVQRVPLYLAGDIADWALPVLFAGIRTEDMTEEAAMAAFIQRWSPSNHQILEIQDILETQRAQIAA